MNPDAEGIRVDRSERPKGVPRRVARSPADRKFAPGV